MVLDVGCWGLCMVFCILDVVWFLCVLCCVLSVGCLSVGCYVFDVGYFFCVMC